MKMFVFRFIESASRVLFLLRFTSRRANLISNSVYMANKYIYIFLMPDL